MCFQIDGKSAQESKCVKSRIMNKVIDCVIQIYIYGQQCVVLKGKSQSPRLKDYMKNIGIDQSLRNSANFEHRFLQNITKLYKHAGKCEDQQQSKDIFQDAIISTPERFTNNNPRSLMTPTTVKKPSARKSLCLFTNILDVKKKADIW